MDNALLINLSGQLSAYQAMDVIANNLANMSTPGFKREGMQFQEYLENVPPAATATGLQTSQPLAFVQNGGVFRDVSEGPMNKTGDPLDLAIAGSGFFQVQTPNGVRYTRDGHFQLDAQGQIVDDNGYPLIGDGGPITVTPQDGNIYIATDGTVSGAQGQIGTIKIVGFASQAGLSQQGSNLYATSQQPQANPGGLIQQGMLEGSNVQPIMEMSTMIKIMRKYQMMAALTKSQQQLQTQAIDKLGTVQP
ncbi:MAG: flagellar basal-body rod protein FlgF [Alphaproteobacteria bacterium]|nr:flagellar basal-body rod protein FlgF [Alphaproteobacteria bacterium]